MTVHEKRVRLLGLVGKSAPRNTVRSAAKRLHRAFPTNGCAAFVSAALTLAGFAPVSIVGAEELADELVRRGWRRIEEGGAALPGDIFVTVDGNGNRRADHIGFVLEPPMEHEGRLKFLCVDNRTGEFKGPYRRNVYARPGGFTPVDYWLRAPAA